MADRMLELYTHGQIIEFVVDEINLPEERHGAFEAHLVACEICGPMYRTAWGTNDSEPCSLEVFKQFISLLVVQIRLKNLARFVNQGQPRE